MADDTIRVSFTVQTASDERRERVSRRALGMFAVAASMTIGAILPVPDLFSGPTASNTGAAVVADVAACHPSSFLREGDATKCLTV